MTSMHLAEVNSGSNRFLALASLDQAALDALPEAVYLCAPDGRVVRFNQKAVELWDAPRTREIPRSGSVAASGFIGPMVPCCPTINAPWQLRCRRASPSTIRK